MDKNVRIEPVEVTKEQDSEFAALFALLDQPSDVVNVDGGYAELMSRLTSQAYRKRHGVN